ncbi:hypothetical protein NC651_000023 [Populus alba x Populus x berolinensis]|nr:hypothetical protein NC651_000023 [Populus alba x Populus x berolinensis]
MTGVKRRNTVATAAVPEKVRALRREFWRFCCLELEWGLGFCGEGKEGGEMISHLMEEARGLTVARCFLREEKMVVLRGALVTRLVDAVKDMALGRGIWRGRTRNGCSQVDNGSSLSHLVFSFSFRNSCSLEFDNPERPECSNLLSVYQLVSGRTKEELYVPEKMLV